MVDTVDPGVLIAGRYKVLGEIGRGGMGVVYRVEHIHTGDELALKLLAKEAKVDAQAVARFKREARASAQIRSEHVVRVTDADTAPELDGAPFLVMELLNGVNLEDYLVRRGALSAKELVSVLSQVARVLESAHRIGIVHRDLKPENLFLHEKEDGTKIIKVLDFGISKFASADALESAALTTTGLVLGTPLYMAPEQAHGHNHKIAPTTDVWALGLVAMRLFTADRYWEAQTMMELMMKIGVDPIVPPSERWPDDERLSSALDAWFLRSCDRDQEKRWPSVEVQVAELASALRVERTSVAPLSLELDRDRPVAGSDEPTKSDPEVSVGGLSSGEERGDTKSQTDEERSPPEDASSAVDGTTKPSVGMAASAPSLTAGVKSSTAKSAPSESVAGASTTAGISRAAHHARSSAPPGPGRVVRRSALFGFAAAVVGLTAMGWFATRTSSVTTTTTAAFEASAFEASAFEAGLPSSATVPAASSGAPAASGAPASSAPPSSSSALSPPRSPSSSASAPAVSAAGPAVRREPSPTSAAAGAQRPVSSRSSTPAPPASSARRSLLDRY